MKYNPYLDDLNVTVFDIETMGLSAERDMIISACFCDEDGGGLRRYFCDDPASEYLLITKIIDELNYADAVITYNGERFDLPFVAKRAAKYGIDCNFGNLWDVDIFRYLRKYWPAGKLMPSLSQSSVEKALGLSVSRTDRIDGSECISLYNRYIISGSEEAKEKILLHNGDDVCQLSRIAQSLSFLPFHQIIYENGRMIKLRESFPGAEDLYIAILPPEEKADSFVVNANAAPGIKGYNLRNNDFSLEYDSFSGSIRLEIKTGEIEDYKYTDLSKLPVRLSDYEDLEGFTSNYLILKQGKELKYREINRLVCDLIERII